MNQQLQLGLDEDFSSTVSAIIPARDEEQNIRRAVESLHEQAEISEIVVVNDQSTDGTAAVLADMLPGFSKLRVLETGNLPAGWVGKSYAAWLGARAACASSGWLLFTDADTTNLPNGVGRALRDAEEHEAALVSYSPEQELDSFWERALIPLVYTRLAAKFSFARVSDPAFPDAAANGQFLMMRRDVYEAIGGHEAVRNYVLEDVQLARRVKQGGYRLYFAPGEGIARTRMYRSFRAMWQGWTKNLYPLIGGAFAALLRELSTTAPSWLAVLLVLGAVGALGWFPADSRRVAPSALSAVLLAVALLLGGHVVYARALRRNRYSAKLIKYYVPGAALYAVALAVSAWRNTWGSVVWKGRNYPAGMP